MRGWSGTRAVAVREVRTRLADRGFRVTTLLLLVLVTAAVVAPVLLSQQVPAHRVAVQGDAARVVVALAAELGTEAEPGEPVPPVLDLLQPYGLPQAHLEPVVLEPTQDAERLVLDEDVSAAVIGDDLADLRLVGREDVPGEIELLVAAAAARLHVMATAEDAGLSQEEAQSLVAPALPRAEALRPRPAGTLPPAFLVVALALLFCVSVLTSGMAMAGSVAEEKECRVVERLVAAMAVRALLAGKVVGSTTVALGQVLAIVAAGLLSAYVTGQRELLAQLAGAVGWFLVLYLLGFVMLIVLWAAAGALAARVEDLQSTTVVMQVLVVVPFFAAVFTLDPGPVQRLLSFVPFTAPLLMPARVVLGTVEPWEPFVAACLLLVLGGVAAMVGARTYRNAVLHTSSRLTAGQAWRGVDA